MEDTVATQTVTLSNSSITTTDDFANRGSLVNINGALRDSAQAIQTVALRDTTVSASGSNANGIYNGNSAVFAEPVQASQVLDLGTGANQVTSAQAYGIAADNDNNTVPPGFATQLLDLSGATISGALGNVLTTGDPTQTVVGI
jgi:hypothetical protein